MDQKNSFSQPEITTYEREEIVVPIAATEPIGGGSGPD